MADTYTQRAEALLKPHRFRYQDRATAQRLGISAVEASGVGYWPAVKIVADLLALAEGTTSADALLTSEGLEPRPESDFDIATSRPLGPERTDTGNG